MSNKTNILKTFNTQFFSFLDDVIKVFPDNTDIIVGKKSFETIKRANPTLIIKIWHQFIYDPYRDSIDNGDIEYFVNKDYECDLTQLRNSGDVLRIINTLKKPIGEMDEKNKQHAANYLIVLSKLSEAYNNIN